MHSPGWLLHLKLLVCLPLFFSSMSSASPACKPSRLLGEHLDPGDHHLPDLAAISCPSTYILYWLTHHPEKPTKIMLTICSPDFHRLCSGCVCALSLSRFLRLRAQSQLLICTTASSSFSPDDDITVCLLFLAFVCLFLALPFGWPLPYFPS